jgi:predicted ATPase/DNA-binding winged helix-turn-helix (wHTH) protein
MATMHYRFDRCELHPAERRLLVDGRPAVLGSRAFDVLLALVERQGRVVTREELLDIAWPGMVVEENNLAVQISALRKLLGSRVIATVAGRGYQFTGELQPLDTAPAVMPSGSNAPTAATRLIGREAELARLAGLLAEHRLVTLVGPGGIGKTRLAIGWCEGPAHEVPVVWVELAGLNDVTLLPATVLAALGSNAAAGAVSLREAIAPLQLTLVLDNAEPVAADVATLVRALLDGAPGLRLLVTSQVPLRLPAEQVYRLGALALPDGPSARVTPTEAMRHGAVALFVERARSADPLFELAAGNVGAVVEICQRLDGLPLALELAAARVASLGVTTLAAALGERLRVLGDAQRSAPARQRTLRAALEWSHGLLDARAQRVFRRLGVFAGGFTLGAAQAVAADDDPAQGLDALAVMTTLGRLVEDSLVARDTAEPPRYGLLESARLFALEQLARSGEAAAVRARHLAWCAGFVGRVLGGGSVDAERAAQVAAEYPNLRAALENALARDGGDRQAGAALAVALSPYWDRLDEGDERRRWLGPAPADTAEPPDAVDATVTRLLERLQDDGLAVGARAAGIDPQTLIALARRLRADEVTSFDGALKEIERAVDIASRVLAGTADDEQATDAFVGDVLAGVAEQTRAGDFDLATDALDDALAELDRRDAQRRAALQRSRRALLEAGVQQDLLRRDAFAVARRIEAIAALDAPTRPTQSALYLERERQACEEGLRQGVSLSLAVAVALMRRRLDAATDPAERRAAVLALVPALTQQGGRNTDPALLEEAVRLCRDALDGIERDVDPVAWGALQHELAGALQRLGEQARSPALLDEAVACCREALKVRRREHDGNAWAESQSRLGSLLRLQGLRDTGSERLLESVAALRESLKERTRSRQPLEWGRTQVMIGVALSQVARREGDLARRHEAAQAFRNALLEITRERAAFQWAATQNNLGIELAEIGEAEGGIETLQAAVDAYREALREWSRERAAAGWATTQHNLGGALRLLGEREPGVQSLRESVLAFREALKEHTRDRQPLHWAAGKNDLGLALLALGRRETGCTLLEQAVNELREALLERRRDVVPVDWATTQCDLAQALFALGERSGQAGSVAAAVAAVDAALEVLTRQDVPDQHARAEALREQAQRWRPGPGAVTVS